MVTVEPDMPLAGAKRIASFVHSCRFEWTRRTHTPPWTRFTRWCVTNSHATLPAPPITIAADLVDAADYPRQTGRRSYAIATFRT